MILGVCYVIGEAFVSYHWNAYCNVYTCAHHANK